MISEDTIDEVVRQVLNRYTECNFRPSNDYQYTVLAAFTFVKCDKTGSGLGSNSYDSSKNDTSLDSGLDVKVVALATGVKCLPTSRYPVRGDALHDSHAEVLSRRSFVRWLYGEVQRAAHSSSESKWIERDEGSGKWRMKQDVRLMMYISTVPCGDASMRFLAAAQDPIMAALKDSAPPIPLPPGVTSRGRDNYSLFGVLRTKPGRADSPPTRCLSCSDKLATFNVLGLQGGLASAIFEPVYMSDIIIGDIPESMRDTVKEDCIRALYGRLDGIDKKGLPENYRLAKPSIHFTSIDFDYSRTSLQASHPGITQPPPSSNESLCWFADSKGGQGQEVIINGVRRGVSPKQRSLEKFRPRVCKLQLFRLHNETLLALNLPGISPETLYHTAKQLDTRYCAAKKSLKGPGGPFAGWVVSGKQWESFNLEGNVHDNGIETLPPTPS